MSKKKIGATLAVLITLSACSSQPQQGSQPTTPGAPATTPGASTSPNADPSAVAVVPGYAPGQFPPIPAIVVPDISVMNQTTASASRSLSEQISQIPGLKVSPAHCGPNGEPLVGGSVVLGGDGSGVVSGGGASQVNPGDGSGVYTDGETSFVNNGDGSGTLSRGDLSIVVDADGSGVFSQGGRSITLDNNGSGTSSDQNGEITIDGKGGGTYTKGKVSIVVQADGSGTYDDGKISIINDGKGKALVGGTEVKADPIPAVPKAGKFPPINKMAPVEPVCGLYLTLSSEVLFDYDKFAIRSEAMATIEKLKDPLSKLPASTSLQVEGHTDAHGADDYNQTLSEKRASAVADALKTAGITLPITSVGYGETRPVAPNELAGKDNPGGRQLNRRVEIFIPVK